MVYMSYKKRTPEVLCIKLCKVSRVFIFFVRVSALYILILYTKSFLFVIVLKIVRNLETF